MILKENPSNLYFENRISVKQNNIWEENKKKWKQIPPQFESDSMVDDYLVVKKWKYDKRSQSGCCQRVKGLIVTTMVMVMVMDSFMGSVMEPIKGSVMGSIIASVASYHSN